MRKKQDKIIPRELGESYYPEEIEDVYDALEMEQLLEDDEISSEEEAFMMGYMGY